MSGFDIAMAPAASRGGAIMDYSEKLDMMYECFDAVENRRRYKVRRLESRLKEAPACSK